MIRSAALTICISCLLVGLLKNLLPQGACTRVINQLCALYILLSLAAAVRDVPWHELYAMLENDLPRAQALDYTQSFEELYTNEVERRAQDLLREKGVEAETVCQISEEGTMVLFITPKETAMATKAETLFEEEWLEGGPFTILCREDAQ